ncbi:eukaryotic membrane protein family-domain-containing protein, partial [Paraphysoderma sedebokerense]
EYVKGEITAVDFVVTPDVKAERVSNFFAVPREIEKLMLFGYFVCLDSFLNIFTILPIRCMIAVWKLVQSVTKRQRSSTSPIHLIDLQRASLLVIVTVLLFQLNPSRLYHSIRGQALVKLYVIFNVLEICDKLCCSFGMDILDSLVARGMDSSAQGTENAKGDDRDKFKLKPFTHYLLALCYVFIHGVVMFYQVITLNVAINSYNNALLTLLISNQFVEIKSSVFKRFESENLFQLSCSDIVERFNLSAFLLIVIIRNYIELYSSAFSSQVDYLLSTKFTSFFEPTSSLSIFIPSWFPFCWSIISPALLVFASEILVDWMKHAFITKFNGIRPVVYKRFRDVLCKDLLSETLPSSPIVLPEFKYIDHVPYVAKRIGFASLPLAALMIRFFVQILPLFMSTFFDSYASDY